MTVEQPAGGVRAVQNALTVLEALAVQQPVGVSALARDLDLPKSSVQRTLRTLDAAGWAERADTGAGPGGWQLTGKVLRIGMAASGAATLPERARPFLTRLRDTYGETVHLTVPDGEHIIVLARIDGTRNLRTFLEIGTPAPMLSTAGGRAVLAASPPARLEGLLAGAVTTHTPTTTTDPDVIRGLVDQARRDGYATNHSEWRADIAAVGAAVVVPGGRVVGAVSLSMPAARHAELDLPSVGRDVAHECTRIAQAVQHSL